MSPKSTSALSPSDTKWEKPISRSPAQSSIAVASAPDCVMNASVPAIACPGAKLAFRPAPGTSAPMQFGPRIRSSQGRAAASICCSSEGPPSAPGCRSPDDSTIAARVPLRPRSAINPGTVFAGVQITARSGVPGSDCTSRQDGPPAMLSWRLLTGHSAPWKPPPLRLRSTTAPTLPSRSDAPTTATLAGRNIASRLRTLIAHSLWIAVSGSMIERAVGTALAPDQGPAHCPRPEWPDRRSCDGAAVDEVQAKHASVELQQVLAALARLGSDGYGLCQHCGDPIDLQRLAALPGTPLCIACQALHELNWTRPAAFHCAMSKPSRATPPRVDPAPPGAGRQPFHQQGA